MAELDLTQPNGNLTQARSKQIIQTAITFNILPSVLFSQLYLESYWGASQVAKDNNNWGGSSFFYSTSPYTRPSGIIVTRGTSRPSSEGAHYMRFASVTDYFYDYGYLLANQGIYNVKGVKNFSTAIKGLFKAGGATADYAAMPWQEYIDLMVGIRSGINNRNNNIMDKVDANPESYVDGVIPDPDPDPDPEPDPDYEGGWEGVDLAKFNNDLVTLIKKMLMTDVFQSGSSQIYQNSYLQLMNQMKNTFKIKPTTHFFEQIDQAFKDFNDSYIPPAPDPDPNPDPEPEPEPEPSGGMYFPVRLASGVNFWKRANWGVGTLQRNMTYGLRSNGVGHAGYDIGSGGVSGRGIYAVRSGKITHVENRSTAGFVIAIDHSTDEYHTLYMHLVPNSNTVQVGDTVQAGQKIATMGASGGNYAIHLHIELSKTGKFHTLANTFDPEPYLQVTGDNKTALPIP